MRTSTIFGEDMQPMNSSCSQKEKIERFQITRKRNDTLSKSFDISLNKSVKFADLLEE